MVVLCVSLASASDWPQWRGPNFNGSTHSSNLPADWSRTDNIAWVADLPGASAATPIVSGDRVFVSSTDPENNTLLAMCFDKNNGKCLWQHIAGQGLSRDKRSNFAAPSAATDGKIVVFFFSTGDMACYDMAGSLQWARNIKTDYGTFAFLWTFSSSPLLFDGKLYLQVLQRDVPVSGRGFTDKTNESYLLAMNPQTGKTLWRHIRPSKAVAESREAFSSPVTATLNGTGQILIAGGDVLSGHDPQTGKELWRWGNWNPNHIEGMRLVPSPVAGNGIVLACAPKNGPVYAIKPKGQPTLDDSAIAWTTKENREITSDVPTPAFYDGDFFILNDLRKNLSRVVSETGKIKWTVPTPGKSKYEASPLVADGKVYIINHEGDAAVIDADDGKVLKVIDMDDHSGRDLVRASISTADGHLFIRTTKQLYCVGK